MEDNLKLLVAETTRLCREHGLTVDPNVIAYIACISDTQKSWEDAAPGAALAAPMGPLTVSALGSFLFGRVTRPDDPTLATARMQVMMEVSYKKQRDVVEAEVSERQDRGDMLARAVVGPKPLRDQSAASYGAFYRRVFEFVCVASRLDIALEDASAAAEVKAAIESVLPLSGIAKFLTLSTAERSTQTQELSRLVLGILLYNRSEGRGGSALPAATATYLPTAARLVRDLRASTYELQDETALGAAHIREMAGWAQPAQIQRAQLELVNRCQALLLTEALQNDAEAGLDATQQLSAELEHLLMQVQETVGASNAVAKEAVYPLLDRLGTIHGSLHEELRILVVRQRLADQLDALQGGYTSVLQATGRGADSAGCSAAAVIDEQLRQALRSLPEGMSYEPASQDSSNFSIALSGYSPVCLSEHGVLQRASPTLGALRFTDQLYGFCSSAEMQRFIADPEKVMSGAAIHMALDPSLARLLGRMQHMPSMDLGKIILVMSGPLRVDFGCQTPTHFVERHIDHSYEWNEWSLRRRALLLANLRQKTTHSAQTAESHLRRDNQTQVWLPKQASSQTRVTKGQGMPKKLQVVQLELDLGQPHQN
ncbi:MAG: hypothetical protein WDW36_004046 [Sanguina aurantia]